MIGVTQLEIFTLSLKGEGMSELRKSYHDWEIILIH